MGKGYMGKIMMVDLGTGAIEIEEVPDSVYEQLLAGSGLGAWVLYNRVPLDADPLGPDNILGFLSGLLTGSGTFFSGRWMAVGKSPLTKGYGEANCGGTLSPQIKRCGVDGIFFTGISKKPVYLKVVDGKAELVDASHLWGMDAIEAELAIEKEVGVKKAKVATIGPSGEKLSLISGIVNDRGRIAARSGLGAVMGSKKLKGVVLSGKEKIEVADKNRIKELNKKFNKWFKTGLGLNKALNKGLVNTLARFLRISPVALALSGDLVRLAFTKYGTICTNVLSSESGDSPVKNWKGTGGVDFPVSTHSGNLNPEYIIANEQKKYSCYSCPLGCGGIMKVTAKGETLEETHKPEYETCCSFGTLLLNKDLDSIYLINDRLNRAGMDTISAGATVGFALECVEQGVLTKEDLDGIDLKWGDADAIMAFVDKMISREGCGDLFADGSKVAAEKIGKNAGDFAMHAGGQELAMHDTRYDPGFGISYACEPTPGRHTYISYQWLETFGMHKLFKSLPKMSTLYRTKSRYDYSPDKNTLMVAGSKYMQTANGCGMCQFGIQMGGNLDVPAFINAATGWKNAPEQYLVIGGRIQALRQAFNFKHGVSPKEAFKLPRRVVGIPPLETGPLKGITLNENKLHGDFFEGMGWDPATAKPTRQTLEGLGLDDVAKDLWD